MGIYELIVLSTSGAVAINCGSHTEIRKIRSSEVIDGGMVGARSSDRSQSPNEQLAAVRSETRARCCPLLLLLLVGRMIVL